MVAVVHARGGAALARLCGVGLAERHLRALDRLATCERVLLVAGQEALEGGLPPPRGRARPRLVAERREPRAAARELSGEHRVLYVAAETVIDPRILGALLGRDGLAAAADDGAGGERLAGAAVVAPGSLARLLAGEPLERVAGPLPRLWLKTLDPYQPGMRRSIAPYAFPAPASAAERERAVDTLLDASQNGVLDWPAWYVHRPIELALARRLCEAPVTPNQLTALGALLSAVVAWAFWNGRLGLALTLALVVGILDGLDGKQARIKIEASRAGEWEHLVDYALETSWWAGVAHHLARARLATGEGFVAPWACFAALWASDLLTRAGSGFFRRLRGRPLDDWSPVDRFLRRWGGRRNTYVWTLAPLLLAGVPLAAAYLAIAALAVLTAAARWLRIAWILGWSRRRSGGH